MNNLETLDYLCCDGEELGIRISYVRMTRTEKKEKRIKKFRQTNEKTQPKWHRVPKGEYNV